MKPFANIPGVQYPDPAPLPPPKPKRPPKPHGNTGSSQFTRIDGRNYCKRWLRIHGLPTPK